jgi:multidrug efflux pump subunit AcrA (membrane-fusion protein)
MGSLSAVMNKPHRKQPGRQKQAILIVLVLVVLSAGGLAGWYFWLGPGNMATSAAAAVTAAAATQTYTTTVALGDLSISASGSGTLAAGQTADLGFSASGTVTELNVQVGDSVQAGDVLARMAPSPSLAAAEAAAQLQLLQAQQALAALQKNAGLSLAQAYQTLLAAQETAQTAAAAQARMAYSRCSQAQASRYQSAFDQAQAKLSDLASADPASDSFLTAQADYDTALANLNYCAYSEADKLDAAATDAAASLALREAQETYDTLKAASGIDPTQLALAEAKVKSAQTQLADAQAALAGLDLTATISGKVTYLASAAGSLVGTSKYITISDVSQPILNISVDDSDLEKLVVGGAVTVVFDALPDQTFTGSVTQVDPQLTTSGQYKVAKGVVALDEASAAVVQELPIGLSATVTVISQQARGVLLVPVMALKDLGDSQYAVMKVADDGQMSLTVVEIGLQDGTTAVVLSGLQAGDVVSTGTAQASAASSTSDSAQNDAGMMMPDGGGEPPAGGGGPMP